MSNNIWIITIGMQYHILKYKDSDTMPPWNNSIIIIYNQYKEWTIIWRDLYAIIIRKEVKTNKQQQQQQQ